MIRIPQSKICNIKILVKDFRTRCESPELLPPKADFARDKIPAKVRAAAEAMGLRFNEEG